MLRKERTYTKEDIINIISKSKNVVIQSLEDEFKVAAKSQNKELNALNIMCLSIQNVMVLDKLIDVINKEYE